MEYIRDKNKQKIRRSKNLAGIRRHVRGNMVGRVEIGEDAGVGRDRVSGLAVYFENGDSYHTLFSSFEALKGFVQRWRSVYGAPLWVNSEDEGEGGYHNPALKGGI